MVLRPRFPADKCCFTCKMCAKLPKVNGLYSNMLIKTADKEYLQLTLGEKELEQGQWTLALAEIDGMKIMGSWWHVFWTCRENCSFPHARMTWRTSASGKTSWASSLSACCAWIPVNKCEHRHPITSTLGQHQLRMCGIPKMLIYDNLLGCWIFASRTSIWQTAIFGNHRWSTVLPKSSWQMRSWNLRTPIVLRNCLLVPLLKKLQTRYMCWYCWRNQTKEKMGRTGSFKDPEVLFLWST